MLCSLSSHSRDFLLQILAVEVNLHGNLQKKTIESLKRILRNSVFALQLSLWKWAVIVVKCENVLIWPTCWCHTEIWNWRLATVDSSFCKETLFLRARFSGPGCLSHHLAMLLPCFHLFTFHCKHCKPFSFHGYGNSFETPIFPS